MTQKGRQWVECVCGGLIHWQPFPESMIVDERQGIWLHDTGDVLCYPNDPNAWGEPYETPPNGSLDPLDDVEYENGEWVWTES